MANDATLEQIDELYNDNAVRRFHGGISREALRRRRKDGIVSPPDVVIGGRAFTKRSTLQRDLARLAQSSGPRKIIAKTTVSGRKAFWERVQRGEVEHPRTIGKRRREEAAARIAQGVQLP